MSLLSEAVSTVVQSPNPIVFSSLTPPALPNYVTVATCKYTIETPQLVNTTVDVPLNVPIPKNAVVYNMIIDTTNGLVSSGNPACTLGVGLVTPNNLYSDVVTNPPWTTDSYFVNSFMDPLLITEGVSTMKFKTTGSGLVSGSTTVKVLFV